MPTPTASLLYSSFGADPEMGELVDMFVGDLPDRIRAIQRALSAQDYEELERLAHQMKGAAGGYGFDQLPPVALAAEQAARNGGAEEDVLHHAEQLVEALQRVRTGAAPFDGR